MQLYYITIRTRDGQTETMPIPADFMTTAILKAMFITITYGATITDVSLSNPAKKNHARDNKQGGDATPDSARR